MKEIKDKKRLIKQLRDLLYELDTLRTQVEDNDLDAFDTRTMPLRTSILKLAKAYQGNNNLFFALTIQLQFSDLEKVAQKVIHPQPSPTSSEERINPFEGAAHIQIQANLDDLKFEEAQARFIFSFII